MTEPTKEMIEAGCNAYLASKKNADVPATFTAIYSAMEAARPTTDVPTDVLVAELAVFLRNHHIYCTAHDGRFKTAADTLEALQRSNAEKDSRIAELVDELRFASEALSLAGQNYSATRARKVLGDKTP